MAEEKGKKEAKKGSGFSWKRYAISFVDVGSWMNFRGVKRNVQDVKDSIADTFKIDNEVRDRSTFEAAMKKYGLTEEDVEKKQMAYMEVAVFVFALGIGMLAYAFYMFLVLQSIPGTVIALSLTLVIFAVSFKYHFWYYQFKRRKLGCTFKEWKRDFFSRG